MANYVGMKVTELAESLGVSIEKGLHEKEVQKRRRNVGSNQLQEAKKNSILSIFFRQFQDFMVIILLVAMAFSAWLGETLDAVAILAIILLNSVLGTVQEVRAENSLSALIKLSAPLASVLREGEWKRLEAVDLVPGDIIQLESGNRIPADVRFIKTEVLSVEESALTGESIAVEKTDEPLHGANIPLADQRNMGFMGTMVVRGKALALVVGTGMKTEMGKIAHLIQTAETMETPLQRRLEQLGKILVVVAVILTALVVLTGIWQGQDVYQMFLAGVSLAVAAIPEGLPAIVTIALALGVQRMIKRNAIVRKLPSVETLGCATIICSDKTGTLTQNQMTVQKMWVPAETVEVSGVGYQPVGKFVRSGKEIAPTEHSSFCRLLEIAILCNNATFQQAEDWQVNGDPTEGALLVVGKKAGLDQSELLRSYSKEKEYPFDSARKMMTVLCRPSKGQLLAMVKGAPDVLLEKCSHYLQNGKVTRLTDVIRKQIQTQNNAMARQALRVLAFAYREGQFSLSQEVRSVEEQLVFVGLMGMVDPPREEVKEAIERCRIAGIRTVMITGDHQATAEAIAEQLGMRRSFGLTLTGRDMTTMKEQDFEEIVEKVDVFARVTPEHKLLIVKALQAKGHVVAMTGDGVNDAPAIKSADIGIAMGKTGTDVSKEASSLILADDNFSTIVSAIEEGRNIYDNIRKFISYLLASNVGEILIMFFALLGGLPIPLVPIQILWVNLVTDGLPAMALGVDPAEEDAMKRSPRNAKEGIFARGIGWKIVTRGLLIGLASWLAFWVAYTEPGSDLTRAQTIAFATLVFAQLVYVFDCRSETTIFGRNPFSNRPLLLAVASSVLLLLVVVYLPNLQPIFHTTSLGLRDWVLITITSCLPVIVAGLLDQVFRRKQMIAPANVARNVG